jgi:hypothetical protein
MMTLRTGPVNGREGSEPSLGFARIYARIEYS